MKTEGNIMKKILLIVFALSLVYSTVFALTFSPTVLKLTAPSYVKYDFSGSYLSIPVTVTGTPANVSFLIFTNGKASQINMVQNGFLGWHYVNKIDTCLFVAPAQQMEKGANTVVWNGKDEGGNSVSAQTLTYYMWAYDNVSPKVKVSPLQPSWARFGQIEYLDANGKPLANPLFIPGENKLDDYADNPERDIVRKKWTIGNDPSDDTLTETTKYTGWNGNGFIAFQPGDHSKYFAGTFRGDKTYYVRKYEWVPNGESQLQTTWGDNGQFIYSTSSSGTEQYYPGVLSDNSQYLFVTDGDIWGGGDDLADLIYIDISDGSQIRKFDDSKWWVRPNDVTVGGVSNGGFSTLIYRDGYLASSSHSSCIKQLLIPNAEDEDVVAWVNQNGDYIGDHNFEVDSTKPWACNDYNVGPYMYTTGIDANLFTTFPTYDLGAVSFGLIAPDGTGVGNFQFSGETASQKFGEMYADYGSQFDGMYVDNKSGEDSGGLWYIAHDSIKGIISDQVAVNNAAPVAFAVAQNSPNPFNPSTSITFTLAKAGKTTVEVYNVAGQKISTLVNGNLSAGTHSTTWNAAKFSAGVYFYTVRSGDFSRTLKMTLLK